MVPVCDTADEVTQDDVSIVGLEPEAMSRVAAGADPALLTMVRKARGTEAHKAGRIWAAGDDSDVCLTSWLTGTPRPDACSNALVAVLPSGSANPLVPCATAAGP
jgi:hypothetical protein